MLALPFHRGRVQGPVFVFYYGGNMSFPTVSEILGSVTVVMQPYMPYVVAGLVLTVTIMAVWALLRGVRD